MILVRHGRPASTTTCYGRSDPPLAEPPAEVADQLVPTLSGIERCFTSPATRCRKLAMALGKQLAAPVVVTDALHELDFGTWEGVAWDEVDRAGLDAWAAAPLDHRVGGGESGRDVAARVERWLDTVAPLRATDLVVAHAGSLRALAAVVLDVPFDETWRWPVPHATPLRLTAGGFAPHPA